MLDVACGPGYFAAAAAKIGATPTGVDFSTKMVEEARRRYPGIRFEEGDAEKLAFGDNEFDAVVLNFGMLHLARPEMAVNEAHRVLRQNGRLAFTVWDTPDKTAGFGIVLLAIQTHGNMNVAIPSGPPFFRFSDPAESSHVMKHAGFVDIKVEQVSQVWTLQSADSLFDIMYNGSVRNAALLRAQTPEALNKIRLEMRERVEEQKKRLAMPAVLIAGVKGL